MATEIEIPEKEIVLQEEVKETITSITLNNFFDDGGCVIASVDIAGKSNKIVLWDENSTPTYEEAGQYTDEDIINRIKEMI